MNAALPAPAPEAQGAAMHDLMAELFPICRSITGEGVRETLRILGRHVPIEIHEVPSGTRCFDWVVPDEWNVREAYVADETGRRVIDFRVNPLHLVGYSVPFEGEMSLEELKPHLHTRPDLPAAIPYVTSYYEPRWGFCLRHDACQELAAPRYRVKVDTTLAPGSLTYGELLIGGQSENEVLLATNVCHPSMANNELSGPVLTAFLARWLLERGRRLSYRILFLPETIGAIVYLSRHAEELRRRTVAGFQVVCVGGPDDFTYVESRRGDRLTDRVARHVLEAGGYAHRVLDFRHRASDERQWCSPGIDLPVGSLMRSKHHGYAAYHTSLDDLDFVRPEHLEASFEVYVRCLEGLEERRTYVSVLQGCEPNLGRRGLYPTLGGRSHLQRDANLLLDVLAYCDGEHDVGAVAERLGRPLAEVETALALLAGEGLVREAGERTA